MIINKESKNYETNNLFPKTDWYNAGNFIIDETTEEGQQMAQMVIDNYPLIDFEHDGEFVTKVILLDKPERPEEVEGKEIQLVQNEQGEWEYIYVYEDIPLTETELLKRELAEQKALINAILGVD